MESLSKIFEECLGKSSSSGVIRTEMRKSCEQDKNKIVGNTRELQLMCPGLEQKMQPKRDWVAGREGERK